MVDWPPIRLLITGWTVTAVSLFSVGYQYSVMNVAHDVFLDFINSSYTAHYQHHLRKPYLAMLWSITVSLWQAGAMVGSLGSFIVEEKFGRKVTLLVIGGATQIVGSLIMAAAPVLNTFELLAAGRFVSGISAGLVCPTLRVFLCECSPNQYRGTMNSLGGIILCLASMIALILGQPGALGSQAMFPYLLGLCFVPSLLQFAINPFIPPSPKYLYIHEANHSAAVKSLYFYYGNGTNVSETFQEFEQEKHLTRQQLTFCQALKTRTIFFPLFLSFLLGLANSSVGIDLVDSYSTELFVQYGMDENYAKKSSIFFNIPGMIGGVLATLFIVDRCGRRPLLLWTLTLSLICNGSFIALGIFSEYYNFNNAIGILAVATSCLLAFTYGIGPGAIVEFLFAEISPQNVRSVAGSLSEFSFWATNVIYVLLFPPLLTLIGSYVFFVNSVPLLLCIIIFYFKLPETSQRSVMEIVADMNIIDDESDSAEGSPKRTATQASVDSTDDHQPLLVSKNFDASYGSLNDCA